MKRCPTCDKTFADGMKFCQTDGTLLIEDAPPLADSYKTIVGNQSDVSAAQTPVDPFKTVVGNAPPTEEPDSLKTMMVSQEELMASLKDDKPSTPPVPANSAPLIEPKPPAPKDSPKVNDPFSAASNFGNASSSSSTPGLTDKTAIMDSTDTNKGGGSPFESKPDPNDFSPKSVQGNKPIPSPFDGSMIGYQPPAAPPFGLPNFSTPEEPKPKFDDYQEPKSSTPFQEPMSSSPAPPPASPFGNADPFATEPLGAPMQQTEWTPPPAPVSEWQNQDIGSNTPFQPPGAAAGQDQTLAIVSLVCGVLGILCCGLVTGIPAIITGFMAKNNAESNPNQYTGRGLAIAGMITGAISVLFSILGIIYYLVILSSANF